MLFRNKKGQLHIIKTVFIALVFIIFFGLFASTITGAGENFANLWGTDYPLLAWLMSGITVWVFLGGLIGIIALIVFGLSVGE